MFDIINIAARRVLIFEYVRKGHDRAKPIHLIADGAKWIENRADELTQLSV